MKKKTLRVISGGSLLSEDVGRESIRIPAHYKRGSKTLAVLRVEVLSDQNTYPLELTSVQWTDALVSTDRKDGLLTVKK
jgi:hypothetical protein